MAYKVHDAIKRNLQTKFKEICNAYLLELCNMWELDPLQGWFVGDEIGGIWCYEDNVFIKFEDMRYVVENDIPYSVYSEWSDYCVWASSFKQSVPNLKSWCNGCPRVDTATQERLSSMRNELEKAINETKERF